VIPFCFDYLAREKEKEEMEKMEEKRVAECA
jgi:hypothetical protein